MEHLDETQNEQDYWQEVKTVSQERLETARRCLGEWATPQHVREIEDEQRRVYMEFLQHYGAGNEQRVVQDTLFDERGIGYDAGF